MATPTGCIDAADGGWLVDNRFTGIYLPFDFLDHRQHPAWFTTGNKRMRASIYWQISIPAGTTITAILGQWISADSSVDIAGAKVGVWEELDLGDIVPQHDYTTVPQLAPYTSGYGPMSDRPKRAPGYIYGTTDNADGEVLMLSIETEFSKAYNGSSPPGVGNVEHVGRNTDANSWRPYEANEPASSWLAQRVLAKSMNRLLYQSRQVWSVPL